MKTTEPTGTKTGYNIRKKNTAVTMVFKGRNSSLLDPIITLRAEPFNQMSFTNFHTQMACQTEERPWTRHTRLEFAELLLTAGFKGKRLYPSEISNIFGMRILLSTYTTFDNCYRYSVWSNDRNIVGCWIRRADMCRPEAYYLSSSCISFIYGLSLSSNAGWFTLVASTSIITCLIVLLLLFLSC